MNMWTADSQMRTVSADSQKGQKKVSAGQQKPLKTKDFRDFILESRTTKNERVGLSAGAVFCLLATALKMMPICYLIDAWIIEIAFFIRIDALNFFCRCSPMTKKIIFYSILTILFSINSVNYIGITLSVMLIILSILALIFGGLNNHNWMIKLYHDESNEDKKLVKKLEGNISALDKKYKDTNTDLILAKNKIRELKDRIKQNEYYIDEYENYLAELQDQIEKNEQYEKSLLEYVEKLKSKIEKLNTKIDEASLDLEEPEVLEPKVEEKKDELELELKVDEVLDELEPKVDEVGIENIPDDHLKILSCIKSGMSLRQTAEACGCGKTKVAKVRDLYQNKKVRKSA